MATLNSNSNIRSLVAGRIAMTDAARLWERISAVQTEAMHQLEHKVNSWNRTWSVTSPGRYISPRLQMEAIATCKEVVRMRYDKSVMDNDLDACSRLAQYAAEYAFHEAAGFFWE